MSATAGSTTSLDVTWTAPTNTGPAIASYDLQYRAGTSGNFTDGPQNVTGTSAAIASLMASTSHQVQVRATNAEGDGDWSFAGTGRTTATTAPGAPTGLTATASGSTAIDLSWSAPGSTGGSAITGYKIEVSPNGTSGWTDQAADTNSTATTYAHTGLAAGDTRHYRVSAINTNGTGDPSNVDSATTDAVPGAVSDVVVVPVPRITDSLTVSWSAPDNAGKPALTGYDVRYRSSGGGSWTTVSEDATSTSLIIGGLRDDFYDVQVRALNADNFGPWSSTAEGATPSPPERVYANHPLIPDDLGPGDSFRLLYITGATTAATGTGIHTYHNFAGTAVLAIINPGNLVSEWGPISLGQTALVSTPGADARLLTDTSWTETDRGMPIYWLNGARVADDYADFYDGTWADEANPTNGIGQPHSLAGNAPWTGTDHDGTELFNGTASRAVGQASVSVGGLGSTIPGAGPLNGGVIFASTEERPLYGLWHVLVVDENLRLINNHGQPDSASDGSDSRAAVRAQLFTTGPNSSGYGIGGIEFANGSDIDRFLGTVALYTTDTDGDPDLANGLHATLSLERAHEFTWDLAAPAGTVLKPNTTYALVLQGDGGTYPELWTIAADGENVPADGWSLADTLLYHNGTSWVEDSNGRSLVIEMVGPQLETEGPALVSATVGAAGNAVTLVFDENVVLPSDEAEALTFLASLASAFAVTADGAGVPVSGLTASSAEPDQLTIGLSGVIVQGQAVTLTYTDPTAGDDAVALQDVLGNETPTFTTGLHGVPAVINNSTITVLTTTAPGAPTGLTATASGTTAINLSWSAPASTGGSAITGYKIEVSPNGTSGWTDQVANTNSTATTYAHTGLAAGTTRHYRVSAINANGAGTASNVDSATTDATAPGAPTGLSATASGTTAIDLSWSAPASTGGSAITGYKIEVSPNGDLQLDRPGRQHQQHRHHLRAHRARRRHHAPLPRLRHQRQRRRHRLQRRQRHHGRHRPRRPDRPHGHGRPDLQNQHRLDRPGQHRRLRHHRLQDRDLLRRRLHLDRPGRQHQQHLNVVLPQRPPLRPRHHAPLPRLGDQRQRDRPPLQRRQRHHHHHRARRSDRPHGNGQRDHRDQPLLERPGQHRRLRHHRLPDRGLLQWRLQLDQPRRQHEQYHHHLRAHRAGRRHHAPLPRLRHQRQRHRRPLQRRQRHHGRHRPRRSDRPHGHGQRDHRDQPLLECPGEHRRLRHHRLQDRGLLQWHLQLDQPRRQHRQRQHDLRAHGAYRRQHAPLPRVRHQHQRRRHRLQRRQRHHRHHRPRRPDRPHGHGQRDHRDQPLLERPGQHRRLRHHRLQDRGLAQRHLRLDRPGRQHQQHRHHLRAHRARRRRHPPLPRLRH